MNSSQKQSAVEDKIGVICNDEYEKYGKSMGVEAINVHCGQENDQGNANGYSNDRLPPAPPIHRPRRRSLFATIKVS